MGETESSPQTFEPLKITCTSTNCDAELHCFMQTKKLAAQNKGGTCRSCGADLVDWSRLRSLDLEDIDYTFRALQYELIRHHFWHLEIDAKAVAHARRKGLKALRVAAGARLRKYVGPESPSFDGRQTPRQGNAIFYAQHATASCCRKCIEEWHGIPLGKALTEAEVTYLTDLVMKFIEQRLPDLTDAGEYVPATRKVAVVNGLAVMGGQP